MEVTVRLLDGEPTVAVQVLWRGAELNLNRAREEPVERFLQRLGLSCGKQADKQSGGERKRAKKEKKKPAAPGNEEEGGAQVAAASGPQSSGLTVELIDGQGTKIEKSKPVAEALSAAAHIKIEGDCLPIVVNPPSIQKLEVFGQPFAGCPLVASLRCEFCSPSAVHLRWLRQASAGGNPSGQCIGEGQVLWVPEDIVGQTLTLCAAAANTANGTDDSGTAHCGRPKKIVRVGLIDEVPPGWPDRRIRAFGARQDSHVRVVCFNILAAVYSRSQVATNVMYPYCPPHALDFAYRQPLIGRELARLDGDLVFLQECSFSTFTKFLAPAFGSTHHLRISLKASKVSEGCVLLIRKGTFKVLEEKDFLFRNLLRTGAAFRPVLREVVAKWPNFLQGVLPHMTTIFQISVVRHTATGEVLVLANTHLFYHPLARHIRLLQVMCLLHQVQEFRKAYKVEGSPDLPRVVFCGDLNCCPDTAVLQLLLEGKIPSDHPDWEQSMLFAWREEDTVEGTAEDDVENDQPIYGSSAPSLEVDAGDELEALPRECCQPGRGVALENPVGTLASAYLAAPLRFTNYIHGFNATLDWILTAGHFKVARALGGVTEEQLLPHGGLPSLQYPSDHISIAADLEFC